jgi:hypothetical protein
MLTIVRSNIHAGTYCSSGGQVALVKMMSAQLVSSLAYTTQDCGPLGDASVRVGDAESKGPHGFGRGKSTFGTYDTVISF